MRLLLIAGALCGATVGQARAALTHRFDFNTDGRIIDSVGTLTGTLVNGATVTGGQLTFSPSVNTGFNTNPTTGQYATLSDNPIKTQSFTVEAWFTHRGGAAWQRIIDFGKQVPNSTGGTNGNGFAILSPATPDNRALGQLSINSWGDPIDTDYVNGPANFMAVNQQHHIVWMHNFDTKVQNLYIDGAFVGSSPADTDPSTVSFDKFFLGRSMFSADPFFSGSINEISTYDSTLTNNEIVYKFRAGPSVPEPAAVSAVAVMALALGRRRR